MLLRLRLSCVFLNVSPPTETYTLSLHDALPISAVAVALEVAVLELDARAVRSFRKETHLDFARLLEVRLELRSEEHTSELQSHSELVCRLLLAKKKAHSYPCPPRATTYQ